MSHFHIITQLRYYYALILYDFMQKKAKQKPDKYRAFENMFELIIFSSNKLPSRVDKNARKRTFIIFSKIEELFSHP